MVSYTYPLARNRKALIVSRLFLFFLSAAVMTVICQRDEEASKRDQKLQIDVAFIIHGSKNITSPQRKKTYKEALKWAKKIIDAFGEIGINKTRAGLIVYAEKPKLMFNFTEKLNKGDVMGAVDEAESPPALGNKTFTGKALWLALNTLVNGTRDEALKKFFVFSDRPPDDDPMAPALAIQKKKVDLYGLGQTTAPYNDWYISDYSLDSMYAMLAAGPFKGRKQSDKADDFRDEPPKIMSPPQRLQEPNITRLNQGVTNATPTRPDKDADFQHELSKITSSSKHVQEPTVTRVNQVVTTTTPLRNEEVQNPPSSNSAYSPPIKGSEEEYPAPNIPGKQSINSANTIASVISKVQRTDPNRLPTNNYGNDASVIVTANSQKSSNSVGRYSTGNSISYESTDFGTVIGGKKVKGQSQFSVIKPGNQDDEENSNFRSKVRDSHRRAYKSSRKRQK